MLADESNAVLRVQDESGDIVAVQRTSDANQ